MAMAIASAASAGFGAFLSSRIRVTIAVTWFLSAVPEPVTAAFTSEGVNKAVGISRRAAAAMATPDAWAVPITVGVLCWANIRSTAKWSGSYLSNHSSIV